MTVAAPPPVWPVALIVLAAYLLGGLSPGWWLVRRKTGIDLRQEGSGATGATNAARILGRRGYALVLILDALKGLLAVLAARALCPGAPWALLAAPAVVAGHIWPVWLRLRGGRGAAPLMGAFLGLHLLIVPLAWIPGGLVFLLARKGFAARATAYLTSLPIGLYLLSGAPARAALISAWALVLLAHRSHFRH